MYRSPQRKTHSEKFFPKTFARINTGTASCKRCNSTPLFPDETSLKKPLVLMVTDVWYCVLCDLSHRLVLADC